MTRVMLAALVLLNCALFGTETFGQAGQTVNPVPLTAPTVNTTKAGVAIPVKFALGGNKGLKVFSSGYPAQAAYPCGTNASTDAIETTLTAGSSSLSYDAATATYTYVWKTDKTWASSCRELTLRFHDGTIKKARFQFTK